MMACTALALSGRRSRFGFVYNQDQKVSETASSSSSLCQGADATLQAYKAGRCVNNDAARQHLHCATIVGAASTLTLQQPTGMV